MRFCLSTNGLESPEKLPRLKGLGVRYVTVTVNAVKPEIAEAIYDHIRLKRRVYKGKKAAQILLERQLEGIYQAAQMGFLVKVNTVFIPEINGDHLLEIAHTVKAAGAYIMNIMPLIPLGRFADLRPPTVDELKRARLQCEPVIRQWYLCKQCRADAVGIPGEEEARHIQKAACPYTYPTACNVCRH